MRKIRSRGSCLLVAAAAATVPSSAWAQTCLGIPAPDDLHVISSNMSLGNNAVAFGGNLQSNVQGPLSLGAGFQVINVDDVDENALRVGGAISYELTGRGLGSVENGQRLSICPTASVDYQRLKFNPGVGVGDAIITTLSFPLGIAAGINIPVNNEVSIHPYAFPHALLITSRTEVANSALGVSEGTERLEEFGINVGGVIRFQNSYFGAAYNYTTIDGQDATVTITFGLRFRSPPGS